MTSALARVLAAFALTVTFALPTSRAEACWDGFRARVGAVEETGGVLCWSEREVRERATWLGRIDALLPNGASVAIAPGTARVTVGTRVTEVAWDGRYVTLFRAVARTLGATGDDIARARGEETPVFVVEVARFESEATARTYAASVTSAHGASGFVAVGGEEPVVHVEAREGAYAVYVGAFVDADEAAAAAAAFGAGASVREIG
ncbi:MAG: hypothetical protein OHK0013_49900 [Sandaracinaceae bacterium]